ncbi:MAG: glycosyl transferase family A [Bradyrhizobiaceae bacterium PARB1]|nr:MAG: glycosyl transferase family A [Bradyrhizobiaceae bacterium PARB1]
MGRRIARSIAAGSPLCSTTSPVPRPGSPEPAMLRGIRSAIERIFQAMAAVSAFASIAIPACNEAERIGACLAALAVQRDLHGSPLSADAFEILVFANNCTDDTVAVAERIARLLPQRVVVAEECLPREMSNAGWARKRAMDLAIDRLKKFGNGRVVMTTDADSCVSPTWVCSNLCELAKGVDCVAGYVDAAPSEIVMLGRGFLQRGRLEDTYLRLVAEIVARCDPRPHDPWPNHRVSSGASLAVTVEAYRAIGGLPARPLGEDAALTASLEEAGFKVRHSLDVTVQTSCRLSGRATGGAADTMQRRLTDLDAPCDEDLEPALHLTRRALCRSFFRRAWRGDFDADTFSARVAIPPYLIPRLRAEEATFLEAWEAISVASSALSERRTLRPSELPREISAARLVLAALRTESPTTTTFPSGRHDREGSGETELA